MRVNYDEIAQVYDEPDRDHRLDTHLLTFLEEHSEIGPEQARILDVACGTGKQLTANRVRFPEMRMAGLDRFRGMLQIARKRSVTVDWVHGDGIRLPFADTSFHYVTSQFAYPHIPDKERLLSEAFRVLLRGGRFVMTNIDPWAMQDWILYRYFPAVLDFDFRDFLPVEQSTALMRRVGFSSVEAQRRPSVYPYRTPREFLAYASNRHRASQLMVIPDEAYQEGMRRLKKDAETGNGAVHSSFVFVVIRGDKP